MKGLAHNRYKPFLKEAAYLFNDGTNSCINRIYVMAKKSLNFNVSFLS